MTRSENEWNEEDQMLKALFQQAVGDSPVNIRENVMRKIESTTFLTYEPVIGKKTWVALLSGFFLLMTYLFIEATRSIPDNLGFDLLGSVSDINWEFSDKMMTSWTMMKMPELPYSFVLAILVFIIFGLHFMISFKINGKRLQNYHKN